MKQFNQYEESARSSSDSNWLNLQAGDNKVRIVSGYVGFGEHYDQKLQRSFVCIGEEEGCQYCQKIQDLLNEGDPLSKEISGLKPRVRYLFWVIDRSDGGLKLLKAGYQVFKSIGTLAKSDEYGFEGMPDYDINIQREGSGLDTKYSVIPARNSTPLTEKELTLVEEKATDLDEIIEKMKAKVSTINEPEDQQDDTKVGDDMENIPF